MAKKTALVTERTVLITGATGGIGRAVAEKLAWDLKHCYLVLVDHPIKSENLSYMAATLRLNLKSFCNYACYDAASSYADTEMFLRALATNYKHIDVLINIAGIAPKKMMPLVKTNDDEARKIMDVNYWGTRNICKAVLPLMRANGFGRIVNVASISALMADPGNADYSASKAAVVQLTRALAKEAPKNLVDSQNPYNITVNAVAPGIVDTPMANNLSQGMIDGFKAMSPIARLVTPAEVAEVIFWLATKAPQALNGAIVPVDGGFLA